jgi:hypothetical protein
MFAAAIRYPFIPWLLFPLLEGDQSRVDLTLSIAFPRDGDCHCSFAGAGQDPALSQSQDSSPTPTPKDLLRK